MARTIGRRKVSLVIPNPAVAVPISTITKFATDIEVYFPSTNAASVGYFGDSTVDATWIPRAKGSAFNVVHGEGTMDGDGCVASFNLAKLFVYTASPGDECIVEYMDYDAL